VLHEVENATKLAASLASDPEDLLVVLLKLANPSQLAQNSRGFDAIENTEVQQRAMGVSDKSALRLQT
jgi:hypothetical protein